MRRLRFGEDAPEVLVEGMDAGGQRIIGNAAHIAWSTIRRRRAADTADREAALVVVESRHRAFAAGRSRSTARAKT